MAGFSLFRLFLVGPVARKAFQQTNNNNTQKQLERARKPSSIVYFFHVDNLRLAVYR